MAARIRSLRNGITPVDEASRNDLVIGDVVVVSSLDAGTTYNWTLTYVPEGSLATFSGSATAVSPGSFTIDRAGAYMVRLVIDAGLPTQSTQYVRLRALTTTLGLTLVAAGERRDGTGIIPVDVDPTGWADEVNNNLLALEAAIAAGGKFGSQASGGAAVAINPVAGANQYLTLGHAGATLTVAQPASPLVMDLYIEKSGVGAIAAWAFTASAIVWQTLAGAETTLVGVGDVLHIHLVYKGGGAWKGWAYPKA